MADRGRTAVYEAELMAFEGTELEAIVPFRQLTELAARILDGPWWPCGEVVVRRGRTGSSSSNARTSAPGAYLISIAAPQSTPATLVHELAHTLAGPGAGHGPIFRRAHVDLACVAFGPERGGWLEQAYRAARLDLGHRRWPAPPRGQQPNGESTAIAL